MPYAAGKQCCAGTKHGMHDAYDRAKARMSGEAKACPDMHGGQPGCKQQASSGVFALTCTAKRGNIENRRRL
ncbi:hypothetical protein DW057_09120 [Lachnospira eligens]|nr:hypothetical protein DW057_09120 [Lachnospira eligens]